MKIRRFTVEGLPPFPWDMLRYDCAWPDTEADSSEIEASVSHGDKRRVTLASAGPRAPCAPRWESFRWRVVRLDLPKGRGR